MIVIPRIMMVSMNLFTYPVYFKRSINTFLLVVLVFYIASNRSIAVNSELPLFTSVNESALRRMIPGKVSYYQNGVKISLPRGKGLCDTFALGVFTNYDIAKQQLLDQNPESDQTHTISSQIPSGIEVKSWDLNSTDYHHIVVRLGNVVFNYNWNGSLETGISYADGVADKLKNDSKLAKLGNSNNVNMPDIQLAATYITSSDNPCMIIYRSSKGPIIHAVDSAVIRRDEIKSSQRVHLISVSGSSRFGVKHVDIHDSGSYTIALTFVSTDCIVFTKEVQTMVISERDKTNIKINEWQLPQNRVYLYPIGDKSQNSTVESIVLQENTLGTLRTIDNEDALWYQLSAWNTLAHMLNYQYLPPVNMLKIYRDIAVPGEGIVAVASYSIQGVNNIVMSELGRQIWMYVEQPSHEDDIKSYLSLKDIVKNEDIKDPITYNSFTARAIHRMRSTTNNDIRVPVRILLIHGVDPSRINLRYPGYF